MSQDTPSVNGIIVRSLKLIGELGVGEIADSFMLSEGLLMINEILNGFSAGTTYIPYLTTLTFNLEANKPTYSISNLIPADVVSNRIVELVFAEYTVDDLVYVLEIISKGEYYDNQRLDNLDTRPEAIFLNKQASASYVTLYPIPDNAYTCRLQVKSMLDRVAEHQVLSGLPPYFYGFLVYAMGKRWLSYYPTANWSPQAEEIYQEYFSNLKNANEVNLTLTPSGILVYPQPSYWPAIVVG